MPKIPQKRNPTTQKKAVKRHREIYWCLNPQCELYRIAEEWHTWDEQAQKWVCEHCKK